MKKFYSCKWDQHVKILVTAVSFLLGMVTGFLLAPIKKGIYCGNYNGNTQIAESDEERQKNRSSS